MARLSILWSRNVGFSWGVIAIWSVFTMSLEYRRSNSGGGGFARHAMFTLVVLTLLCCITECMAKKQITCDVIDHRTLKCNGEEYKSEARDIPGSSAFYFHLSLCISFVLFAGMSRCYISFDFTNDSKNFLMIYLQCVVISPPFIEPQLPTELYMRAFPHLVISHLISF